jgi:hypothetical protein
MNSYNWFPEFHNDPNVVWMGIAPMDLFLVESSKKMARMLQPNIKPEARLVFDLIDEGQFEPALHKAYSILRHCKNVDYSKVYYLTGAFEGKRLYDEYCKRRGIPDHQRIHIYVGNMWEQFTMSKEAKTPERGPYDTGLRSKLFLCFNRMLRTHRMVLVGLMENAGLIDRGYCSFFLEGKDNFNLNGIDNHLKTVVHAHTYNETWRGLNRLRDTGRLPLKLNIEQNVNMNVIQASDLEYYDNSYFSLVTETHFFPTVWFDSFMLHEVIFTEKTYKPIAMKHPFLIVGPQWHLYHLRSLGYKTFHPWINETYDTIANHEKRLFAILQEVTRLSQFTNEQWLEWQQGVKDIVEHNYAVIHSRKNQPPHLWRF